MIRNPVAEFLARRPVMILDGALASELERRGADLRDMLWSAKLLLEQPSLIQAVHRDYFEAGADVAVTATYQASFEGFARRGIDAVSAARLMRDAVALAVAAREEFWRDERHRYDRLPPLIAASVGPYGAMLADGSEYRGHYGVSDDVLTAFHRPRLLLLADSGADLLACETIPSLREALVLARLLQERPGTAAWISFACRDAQHTCEGESISDCAAVLGEFAQVISMGVNCTPPRYVVPLLRQMRLRTNKPLLAYPQADASTFAEHGCAWYDAGARLIGGCCGTNPEDIRRLCKELRSCA
ncbi:MAG TPA: homocysteine S-methyltransferase [Steroidobacteraceae bacterium]|jgi:homocysteine S-methyltransferase